MVFDMKEAGWWKPELHTCITCGLFVLFCPVYYIRLARLYVISSAMFLSSLVLLVMGIIHSLIISASETRGSR